MIQKKVLKEVEALAESMRITKEAVQKAGEENILLEEQTVKKQSKPKASKPNPSQDRRISPSSGTKNLERQPKPLVKLASGSE